MPFRHLVLAGLLALAGTAMADQSGAPAPGMPPRDRPHGPPPESIKACATLAKGSPCSFVTPHGHNLSGVCDQPPGPPPGMTNAAAPANGIPPIACRPDKMPPPPGGHRPPPAQ